MPTSPPPETAVRVRNVIPDIFVNREPQGLWGPDGVGVVKDPVSRPLPGREEGSEWMSM